MKRIITTIAICIFVDLTCFSQQYINEYNNIIKRYEPQSPQVSMMQRFGNYPVDYSTGIPNVSIPIYTIRLDDFELPISIDYHNSGIRVQDISTPVGIGWLLNAGGCISRTIMGADDNHEQTELYGVKDINSKVSDGRYGDVSFWEMTAKGDGTDLLADRYDYNFCNHSGIFRREIRTNNYKTFPFSKMKIETKKSRSMSSGVSLYRYTPFLITDERGIEYHFDYPEGSRGDYTYGGNAHLDSYHLSKIILPNKKDSIVLKYSSGCMYNVHSRSGYIETGPYYSPHETTNGSGKDILRLVYDDKYTSDKSCSRVAERNITLLTDITWNGNKIHFDYVEDRKEHFLYSSPKKMSRLKRITVSNYLDSIIKIVELDNDHYLGTKPSNYRMKLNGISITNAGNANPENYTFEYDETATLPNYCHTAPKEYADINCHEDYWGYYNGTDSHLWVPEAYSVTGEGADRNPDGRLMKAGSLVSVTYPTGGKTVFEMESNKLEDGSIWGGLRVKSISNYDSDGNTLLSYKRYEYQDVRQSVSKDDFSKLYSFLSDYSFYMEYDDVWFDGHGATCRNTSVSIPAIPLSADYGSPIYYYKVTEYLEDNNGILGKNIYTFEDGRTDDMVMNGYVDNDAFACNSIQFYSQWSNFDFGKVKALPTSEERYDREGKLESSIHYDYDEVLMDTVLLGVRFLSSVNWVNYSGDEPVFSYTGDRAKAFLEFLGSNYSYNDVWGVPSYKRLASTTKKQNGITEVVNYNYDDNKSTLHPIETTVSNGSTVLKTTFLYPCMASDSVAVSMADRNLQIPIKTARYRNGVLASIDSTAYKYSNGAYMPHCLYHSIGCNMLEKRIEYEYDSSNSIINICKDNADDTYFIWGYKGLYPIAKIQGMKFVDIQRRLSSALLNQLKYSSDRNEIDRLLDNVKNRFSSDDCLITIYKHKPLVGITDLVAPNGMQSRYVYDSAGRLKEEKDSYGTIKHFDYNYKNK